MIYRGLGLMSGSSLDGLDLALVEFQAEGAQWHYRIEAADCYPYSPEWRNKLLHATGLTAKGYLQLHVDYGHYLGLQVNRFIQEKGVEYRVGLISSHGHTTFHQPATRLTAQLGDGAALAATTRLPVITDLRAMDVALGGQGAPIVPIGERLLFPSYDYFLNIGGIANLSLASDPYLAFDVCPANRVLNVLAEALGHPMDKGGAIAKAGTIDQSLLDRLNSLEYYQQPAPKSLPNEFGTEVILPMLLGSGPSTPDLLATYTAHIAAQIHQAFISSGRALIPGQLMITGGGAFNDHLIEQLADRLQPLNIGPFIPDAQLVQYKEALIMAFIGVLRWRQENTVIESVTGATAPSIGGALWMGQEA
ncbi:MAG: anhydro-N-acetylmuramic acid kinase [Bacteroidetes bacterium]|nr:anhydro-N-acetylmuramic acid kinase [Bacteroidota bacterium]